MKNGWKLVARLGRKGRFQAHRLAGRQMCQDEMQLAGGAGKEAGAGPLRRDRFSVRPDKCDGCNPILPDLATSHQHSHRDIVTFVLTRCDSDIKRRGNTKGPGSHREVNCNAFQA